MNTTFIYQNTQLPGFLQFPEFLLRVPISQTAKTVYLVLYDRARLSMRNEWTDEFGRVFVIYPITELADRIGKSESTVKAGMKELCQAGLLLKRPGGFSKPNYLYLKYALEGQFSDRMGKQTAAGTENSTSPSRVPDFPMGSFPPANKVMRTKQRNHNYRVSARDGAREAFPDYSCEEGESL